MPKSLVLCEGPKSARDREQISKLLVEKRLTNANSDDQKSSYPSLRQSGRSERPVNVDHGLRLSTSDRYDVRTHSSDVGIAAPRCGRTMARDADHKESLVRERPLDAVRIICGYQRGWGVGGAFWCKETRTPPLTSPALPTTAPTARAACGPVKSRLQLPVTSTSS